MSSSIQTVKILTLDASNEASVSEAVRQVKDIPIDLLLNVAGVGIPGTLDTATKDDMVRQFEVNTVRLFLVFRALLPNLKLAAKTDGSASIAQISSIMVVLNMIMRTVAIEMREASIQTVKILTLDASNEASVSEAVRQVKDIPIDLLLNVAGVGIPGTLDTATKDDMVRQFEVNTVRSPRLWVASSATTAIDFNMLYGYSASKVVLNMIMRTVAIEMREASKFLNADPHACTRELPW
ncbi:Short chain dehydrogenase [Phytophthora palmivora]|uniref:Short chain dehydrogenase n=1 Tax=Phytophthora palmivora TaxID=4796 RepID=A0A2P4XB35_9STRA|nr:Short chain dehydrogenase [Phytophthora palmivora]